MQLNVNRARQLLLNGDLCSLFVEELGWDRHHGALEVSVDGSRVTLKVVAQKRGMVVYECPPLRAIAGATPSDNRAGASVVRDQLTLAGVSDHYARESGGSGLEATESGLFNYATRKKIEHRVTKSVREHIIIFTDATRATQVWQWVRREPGKPLACREHTFHRSQTGDSLLQKLNAIAVSLNEEEAISLPEVTGRARVAFDVERVTKRFYEHFQKEHTDFIKFIEGISETADREWYASVMLNRLMFVYFIQRKGFLDNDRDYLRNRLIRTRKEHGKDKFYSFYKYFLLRLFHQGLGGRKRTPELERLVGEIPYLNGGLFDIHELEKPERYGKTIEIPDSAFERIFNYFDQYQWHLDERPLRQDNEINPDVLGYIFEKYINQKQMGAYYTKEDITEYISKNTVLPFIFDAAKKQCAIAFENPKGPTVWDLLRNDPDRYIYPAVRHGMSWDIHANGPLEKPHRLPSEIAIGLSPPSFNKDVGDGPVRTIELRKDWNKPAPPEFALPTETWREVIARRQRYSEVRSKLSAGEVRAINDFITFNLDIRQFAQDVIENCDGPELLRALWHSIERVTILDPTCGSGAFLFAALSILEPLYECCLDRMDAFLEDAEHAKERRGEAFADFRRVLGRVVEHPNRRYFILKSIILYNIYGVDIMDEAVEICKLRLFLKLAAQVEPDATKHNFGVEPLPDIDFNIQTGNTLVGYTNYAEVKRALKDGLDFDQAAEKITAKAAQLQKAFDAFRDNQVEIAAGMASEEKTSLQILAKELNDELNLKLATEYKIVISKKGALENWRSAHQPFHWFVEFYGIMAGGGFDVIIGNPPYVASANVAYLQHRKGAPVFPDIYAHIALRSLNVTFSAGRVGMIVPLSLTFSGDFGELRQHLCRGRGAWFSSFDNIPASVFDGVSQRCTIWIGDQCGHASLVSPMYRWRSAYRQSLIQNVTYVEQARHDIKEFGIPKLYSPHSLTVLNTIHTPQQGPNRHVIAEGRTTDFVVGYSQAARNFISVFREDPPCLDARNLKEVEPSKIGHVVCSSQTAASAALASLAGELYFYYWLIRGDGFDVTAWIIKDYLRCLDAVPSVEFGLLARIGALLHEQRFKALVFKKNAGKYVGNYNYRSQFSITRRADLLLLSSLGLGRTEALDVFDQVQRVLAINERAGEKGIPDDIKAIYPPLAISSSERDCLFRDVDEIVRRHFGFAKEDLDFIINHEVTYGQVEC